MSGSRGKKPPERQPPPPAPTSKETTSGKPVTLFTCGKCKQKRSLKNGTYCPTCKPVHQAINTGQETGRAAPRWQVVTEDARKTLMFAKHSSLRDHQTFATAIRRHASSKVGSTGSSGFGDQNTIWEEGTASVDFQGIRQGSSGSVWLDYQGQVGKAGQNRSSFWQVMIVCGQGTPSASDIEDAIDRSHGTADRSLVITANTQGRPN